MKGSSWLLYGLNSFSTPVRFTDKSPATERTLSNLGLTLLELLIWENMTRTIQHMTPQNSTEIFHIALLQGLGAANDDGRWLCISFGFFGKSLLRAN